MEKEYQLKVCLCPCFLVVYFFVCPLFVCLFGGRHLALSSPSHTQPDATPIHQVKRLEEALSKIRREESVFKKFKEERMRSERQITDLQSEIEKTKTQRLQLQKKIKEDQDKYREWRQRHHKEVQQLRRVAQRAECSIRKLTTENTHLRNTLRRREEEKAAAQRTTREVALANARTAKTAASAAASVGGATGGVKTRSAQQGEKIDR